MNFPELAIRVLSSFLTNRTFFGNVAVICTFHFKFFKFLIINNRKILIQWNTPTKAIFIGSKLCVQLSKYNTFDGVTHIICFTGIPFPTWRMGNHYTLDRRYAIHRYKYCFKRYEISWKSASLRDKTRLNSWRFIPPCLQEVKTVTLPDKKEKARIAYFFYINLVGFEFGSCCITKTVNNHARFHVSFEKGWPFED